MTATLTNQAKPISLNLWQVFGATCIGKAHIDSGLPNQDNLFFEQTSNFCVAVVCDGAGSARYSQDGSRFFAQAVGQWLQQLATTDAANVVAVVGQDANALVIQGLSQLREQLARQLPADSQLRDYHTTVTAVLILPTANQALLVQVGDSPLLTSQFVVNHHHIDYFNNLQLFGDDSKNEYVNETHFITQDNWQDFLRVQWLDVAQVDCLALMSDGCADLVLQGASQTPKIYRPFFGNLLFNICQSQTGEQGNAMIEQAIGNPATYRLTGDDKTLIVLLKNGKNFQGLEPMIDVEQTQTTPTTTPASVWATSADGVQPNSNAHLPTAAMQTATAQNANLQTTMPATKPLPQAVPISASSKQRRNTAVIASVAILAGAGVLGWLNWHKIQSLINPHPPVTATDGSPNNPQKTVPTLPPLVLSPTSQLFDLNTDLMIGNVSSHFFVQTVMAIPKAVLKNLPATQLPVFDGHSNLVDAILINPNRLPFNQSTTNEAGETLQQRVSLDYKFNCEPMLPNHQPIYQTLGINFLPEYTYQVCRIDMIAPNNPSMNFVLDPQVSRVFMKGGVGQLLGHETTPAIPAIEQQKNQLGAKLSAIKLYYLPNSFLPTVSQTQAATRPIANQPTAATPKS